jgi:hypothetical protein
MGNSAGGAASGSTPSGSVREGSDEETEDPRTLELEDQLKAEGWSEAAVQRMLDQMMNEMLYSEEMKKKLNKLPHSQKQTIVESYIANRKKKEDSPDLWAKQVVDLKVGRDEEVKVVCNVVKDLRPKLSFVGRSWLEQFNKAGGLKALIDIGDQISKNFKENYDAIYRAHPDKASTRIRRLIEAMMACLKCLRLFMDIENGPEIIATNSSNLYIQCIRWMEFPENGVRHDALQILTIQVLDGNVYVDASQHPRLIAHMMQNSNPENVKFAGEIMILINTIVQSHESFRERLEARNQFISAGITDVLVQTRVWIATQEPIDKALNAEGLKALKTHLDVWEASKDESHDEKEIELSDLRHAFIKLYDNAHKKGQQKDVLEIVDILNQVPDTCTDFSSVKEKLKTYVSNPEETELKSSSVKQTSSPGIPAPPVPSTVSSPSPIPSAATPPPPPPPPPSLAPPPPPSLAPPPPPPAPAAPGAPPPAVVPKALTASSAPKSTVPFKQRAPNRRRIHWDKIDSKKAEETFWKSVDLKAVAKQIDTSLLEKSFALNDIEKPEKGKAPGDFKKKEPKKEKITLLAEKKTRQIELALHKFKVKPLDIKEILLSGDEERITLEALNQLLTSMPEEEDIAAVRAFKGDKSELGNAEAFVDVMASIPLLEKRLKTWLFKQKFSELVMDANRHIQVIQHGLDAIEGSKSFHKILAVILVMGNYLNEGTEKGEAVGFKLSTLEKLSSVRSADGSISFLEFVSKWVDSKSPDSKQFLEDLAPVYEAKLGR